MQVKEIESNGLKRTYHVTVSASELQDELEVQLRAAGKQVKIPGFRPGFVPMKILQQRYGKSLESEVLQKTIQRTSGEVITSHKLRPALTPDVAVEAYGEGKDLAYRLSLELFPELPEIAFDGITLSRNVFEVEEKDIDDACARIAERFPTMAPTDADTAAENGHVVKIDFKGMIDDIAFEGGSAEHFELELGSGQFIEGFEAQLVGCKAGDSKTVTVTFPTDYGKEELAGKEAKFAVTVHQVLRKETPVVDEEFAKARGLGDLRALREMMRNMVIREHDQLVRSQLKKNLFDALDTRINVPLPEAMVQMEFDSIWKRLKEAQAEGDETLKNKSDEELRKEYRTIAERRVKLGIFLAEVSNKNALQVTREELNRAAFQQASMFPQQSRKIMEFYRKHPERMEDLRGPILEEKAVDFILTKVIYDDKKLSLEELRKTAEDAED